MKKNKLTDKEFQDKYGVSLKQITKLAEYANKKKKRLKVIEIK